MRRTKSFGRCLIGDAQRVGEAARGYEDRAVALAFEQRVGGDRGAHAHDVDEVGGQRAVGGKLEQFANALDRPRLRSSELSESSLWVRRAPSGRRATMSVNVPPRSIQNCHATAESLMGTFLICSKRGRASNAGASPFARK